MPSDVKLHLLPSLRKKQNTSLPSLIPCCWRVSGETHFSLSSALRAPFLSGMPHAVPVTGTFRRSHARTVYHPRRAVERPLSRPSFLTGIAPAPPPARSVKLRACRVGRNGENPQNRDARKRAPSEPCRDPFHGIFPSTSQIPSYAGRRKRSGD